MLIVKLLMHHNNIVSVVLVCRCNIVEKFYLLIFFKLASTLFSQVTIFFNAHAEQLELRH